MPHIGGWSRGRELKASGSARHFPRHVRADGTDALEVLRVELRRRNLDPELLLQVDDQVAEGERVQHPGLEQMVLAADLGEFVLGEDVLGEETSYQAFGIHVVHPVRLSSATSWRWTVPAAASERSAATVVAASVQQATPSSSRTCRCASRISVSDTRTATPLVSRSMRYT